MAVGYLAQDWGKQNVFTQNVGKSFEFASHDFEREGGKIGIAFYEKSAFAFYDEDADRYMTAKELAEDFRERYTSEEEYDDYSECDDLYVEVIDSFGSVTTSMGDLSIPESSEAKIQLFYNDVARYWK